MALKAQHLTFIRTLAVGNVNQQDAYLVAYPGVTVETARVNASKLLMNANMREALDKEKARLLREIKINAEEIIREEKRLAFSDPKGLYKGWLTIPPDKLPEDVSRAISDVESKTVTFTPKRGPFEGVPQTTTTYKYKFWNKGQALDRLSRQAGLYEKDNKQKTDLTHRFSPEDKKIGRDIVNSLSEKVVDDI